MSTLIWMSVRPLTTLCLVLLLALSLSPAFFHGDGALAGTEEPTRQDGRPIPAADTRDGQTHGTSTHRVMRHLEAGIAEAGDLLARYGYTILFIAILVEGFGIPAPGQTLLMAASMDAAEGKLSAVWVLAFAFLAAVVGNAIGYAIGRWGGHPLLKRLGVRESRFAPIEKRFAKSGVGVLLVARFFDGVRQLNGIVAGLLEMPLKKFAFWSTLGGVLWTAFWGLGFYFLGKKMHHVHLTFKRIEPLVIVLSVAAIVTLLVYLLRRRGKGR